MEQLSDSALFISFEVKSLRQTDEATSENNTSNFKSSNKTSGSRSVELLVGPCPAAKLVLGVRRRQRFVSILPLILEFNQVKRSNLLSGDTSVTSTPASLKKGLSKHGKYFGLSIYGMTPTSSTQKMVISREPSFVDNFDAREMYENIQRATVTLEELYDYLLNSKALKLFPETCELSWGESYIRNLFQHIRSQIMPALAPSLNALDASLIPEYSTSGIVKCIEQDVHDAQILTPLRDFSRSEALLGRYEFFIDAAVSQIRNYILFSARMGGRESDALGLSNTVQQTLRILLEKYVDVLRKSLKPYIDSKAVFSGLTGQAIKNSIIRLVIEKNESFEERLLPLLRLVNLSTQPNTQRLALSDKVDKILEWYCSNLQSEMKAWISKVFENSKQMRENKYNFPWDFENDSSGRLISHIPESIAIQANVYIEMCHKEFTPTNDSKNHIKLKRYDLINQHILDALQKIWLLVSEQYHQILISKSWEQQNFGASNESLGTSDKDSLMLLNMLIAIVNDCQRIITVHVPSLLSIPIQDSTLTSKGEKVLQTTFHDLQSLAIKLIVRFIISSAYTSLIDFDNLWSSASHSNVARNLINHMKTWLLRTRKFFVDNLIFEKVVEYAVSVLVARYLLMLHDLPQVSSKASKVIMTVNNSNKDKDKAGSAPGLTLSDLSRINLDINVINTVVEELLVGENASAEERSQQQGRRFICLEMISHIYGFLVNEIGSKPFEESFMWFLEVYAVKFARTLEFMEQFLIEGLLPLKPPTSPPEGELHPQSSSQTAAQNKLIHTIWSNYAILYDEDKEYKAGDRNDKDLIGRIFGGNHRIDRLACPSNDESSSSHHGKALGISKLFHATSITTTATGAHSNYSGKESAANMNTPLRGLKAGLSGMVPNLLSNKSKQSEEYALYVLKMIGVEAPSSGSRSVYDHNDPENNLGDTSDNSDDENNESGSMKKTSMNFSGFFLRKQTSKRQTSMFGSPNVVGSSSPASTELVVIVIGEVEVRHVHTSSLLGKGNPYVSFSVIIKGKEEEILQRVKTEVKWNCSDANWGKETFEIKLPVLLGEKELMKSLRLLVEVFDKERIRRKNLLGKVILPLHVDEAVGGVNTRKEAAWYGLEGGGGEVHMVISTSISSAGNASSNSS